MEPKVRVVVRVRPFSRCETVSCGKEPRPCVSSVLNEGKSCGGGVDVHIQDQFRSCNECYRLDSFYGQERNVDEIFTKEVEPFLPEIVGGKNVTVFAYGATGSGKTYTMKGTDERPGLMPLTMWRIMSTCRNAGDQIYVSYYEVYLDRCRDLLEPKMSEITVLEDKSGKIQLMGLSKVPVRSMEEFHELLSLGTQRRKVGYTELNDISSRSHGVLRIVVKRTDQSCGASITGKINLIDLAGNEDNRRSCNGGLRLQESVKINQSLFALSNVIYALNTKQSRIPYRDSKLTRILQDSLGGDSRAVMIACLNPSAYQEAVHTVGLAARSHRIGNYVPPDQRQGTPTVEVDMEAKLKTWLESKGKTKLPPRSFYTPTSSAKSSTLFRTATKSSTTCKEGFNLKGRKLFDGEVQASVGENIEETSCSILSDLTETGFGVLNEDSGGVKDNVKNEDVEATHDNKELKAFNNSSFWLPMTDFNNQSLDEENSVSPFTAARKENSVEDVLSPIDTNIGRRDYEELCFKTIDLGMLEGSQTRHASQILNPADKDDDVAETTPLNKFHMENLNLKNSLIQGYLTFLNTANKEELMDLKGIGQKRAERILDLRKQTPHPINSLQDLEKIGLSAKQVDDVFRKTARSIFTK